MLLCRYTMPQWDQYYGLALPCEEADLELELWVPGDGQ